MHVDATERDMLNHTREDTTMLYQHTIPFDRRSTYEQFCQQTTLDLMAIAWGPRPGGTFYGVFRSSEPLMIADFHRIHLFPGVQHVLHGNEQHPDS